MAFEKVVPVWNAAGTEPPDTLKNTGFQVGYKPPADYFNWFWHNVSQCLAELQEKGGSLEAVVIGENDDLDNYTEVGLYTYSLSSSKTIANAPEENQSTMWTLPRLMNNSPENVIQIVYTQTNCIYIRNRTDSAWNGWRKMFKDDDIIPLSHGGTGGKTAEQARANLGVAAANHGNHVPDTCTTIEDWNDAVKTGWYMGNNAANAPITLEAGSTIWCFGHVIAHSANYLFQEAYMFTASNDAKSIPKYIRARKEGVWGVWTKVTVQRDVPADAKLDYIKTLVGDAQTQLDNKLAKSPSCIEFATSESTTNGGYIDFHYAGSTGDFTSRIVEEAEGLIQVLAKLVIHSSKQDPAMYLVRNQKLSATEETPTVNGQICWQYE